MASWSLEVSAMLPYLVIFSLKYFQIVLEHLKEKNSLEFLVRDIFYGVVNSQWCTTTPIPVPD